MQFSNNTDGGCGTTGTSEGGMVLRAMGPIAANRANLVADIASLNADGCTPLSESMYEAYLYLSGSSVDYGINSRKSPTVAHPSISSSRQPAPNAGIYQSPLTISCQRNFIVLLTDGIPTADNSANAEIQALIGGTCAGAGDGRCLEEIAAYMYNNDIRPTLLGTQNATTYTIGFGPEVSGSAALQNTAAGAGGVFYEASGYGDAHDGADEHHARHPLLQYVLHGACGVGQRLQPHAEPERPLRDRVPSQRDLHLGRQHQEVQPGSARRDRGRHRHPGRRSVDRILQGHVAQSLLERRRRR